MLTRQKALKIIKKKVDGNSNRKIKLKSPFVCEFLEGTIRHTVRKKIISIYKNGNSVFWVDESYGVRNINMLDTKDLHKMLWQIISDKEKRDIALEHLIASKPYLEEKQKS